MADKPIVFLGSTREDIRSFPDEVCDVIGFALRQAQQGRTHPDAKPLKGFGGAGVVEIVEDHDGDTYRAIYTTKLAGTVYVLHAFQKKSKRGSEVPKPDRELIERRLKRARELHEQGVVR